MNVRIRSRASVAAFEQPPPPGLLFGLRGACHAIDERAAPGQAFRQYFGWRPRTSCIACCDLGGALVLLGLIGYGIAMPGFSAGSVTFDAHTLLFSSMAILCGYQAILFAVLSKLFGIREGLLPPDDRLERLFEFATLEKALLVCLAAFVIGAFLLLGAVRQWQAVDFGALDYSTTMRWVIPGTTLVVLAVQTVLSSFFVSILGMRRR